MQNNATEITHRLLNALDSDYNVIDMPTVVGIISHLEKMPITRDMLEATRLGRYINELRQKTNNQELKRRAKQLLKVWRTLLIPEANGQINPMTYSQQKAALKTVSPNSNASSPFPVQSPKSVPSLKVSPPMAVQNRLQNAARQRRTSLVLPYNQRVSPQLQRMVSPVTSGVQCLVSPHDRMIASPGLLTNRALSPGFQGSSPKMPGVSPPLIPGQNADLNLNQLKTRKRPASEMLDNVNAKRSRLNGGMTADLDVSDSSNSCSTLVSRPESRRDVIVINSDSNSSFPERADESTTDQQQPKKRGRKKGSKNHKNLLDDAEVSFTNKLAVSASRGGSKVKTTQEILAGIQNKNSTIGSLKPSREDLEEKAAKLTERVSIIDRKLNANAHRNKNSQKGKISFGKPNERIIESGSVINNRDRLNNVKIEIEEDEDDVIAVDETESTSSRTEQSPETEAASQTTGEIPPGARSLSVEEARALLPPIDRSVLYDIDPDPLCTCFLKENKPKGFSIEDDEDNEELPKFEMIEDPNCPAKLHLTEKYRVHDVSSDKIRRLHEEPIPNVNGNWSLGNSRPPPTMIDGLYINVVPTIYELLGKDVKPFDSFKKYSVSEEGSNQNSGNNSVIETEKTHSDIKEDSAVNVIKPESQDSKEESNVSEKNDNRTEEKPQVFREWFECVDTRGHNDEMIRILPYCILD